MSIFKSLAGLLLALLMACAPAVETPQVDTTDLTAAVSGGSDSIPVWRAPIPEAQGAALETVRGFAPEFAGAYLKTVKRDDGPVAVDELSADALERANVLILLAYQEGRVVLGVFALNQSSNATALAERLTRALTGAFDARFPRVDLKRQSGH